MYWFPLSFHREITIKTDKVPESQTQTEMTTYDVCQTCESLGHLMCYKSVESSVRTPIEILDAVFFNRICMVVFGLVGLDFDNFVL